MPLPLRRFVLALALAGAAACTPSASEGSGASASPPTPTPPADEVPMTDTSPDPAAPAVPEPARPGVKPEQVKLGERVQVPRQALYGAGVVRPAAAAELGALGLPASAELPALVVLATEHPSLPPPELQVRDRGGQAVLVLTWLAYDAASGPLPEVAEVTYAWTVSGASPRWLLLRKAASADGLLAGLAAERGPDTHASPLALTSGSGPAVSLEPGYLERGPDGFFAQYGQPRPAGVADRDVALAAVRATASGKRATAMEATALASGGVRLRLTLPVDPGLPVWGPRAGDELAIFTMPLPPGTHEWLLELQ